MGVQTNDGGANHVPVYTVPRVVSHSFVRIPRRRFVGAAVHVHTGKDGRVHQLCGPGITALQGHAKQVHVQQRKVPSRIEKKKVEAPKSKFIWQRKEVQPPRAISSQAGQEGGCGEGGKQDLKMANMRGAIVDIPPPFRADPHALGTTLFEWGEDDMVIRITPVILWSFVPIFHSESTRINNLPIMRRTSPEEEERIQQAM
jgi:hypothetical protein